MSTNQPLGMALLSYAHTGHAIGYSHVLNMLDEVAFRAIYDEDEARGRSFAERFGVPEVEADLDRLLARDDIQAVVVTCPTALHADYIVRAARAGKHVLCEKPLATTVADAERIIAACREANVQLHIAFVMRFDPALQRMKQVIDAGEIGRVLATIGGNRGIPPLPPAYPAWITDPAQAGGGALMDHSVHVTDAIRFATGLEATRVSAETSNLFVPDLAVDDAALLLVTFGEDVATSIDPSWSNPAAHPFHYDFYLRVLGTEGTITIDSNRQSLQVTRNAASGNRAFVLEPFGPDPGIAMVRHFVACARDNQFRAPAASGEDGLRALEIALAGYASSTSGQPEPVSLLPV